jgi:F-type H+-transporting ATPase subunit epsilon
MSDKFLNIVIVTPQTTVFSGKATSVNLPGTQSPFEVLFNHAPIVSSLDFGIIKIKDDSNKISYFICGKGFTEVLKNEISIMVESADDYNSLTEESLLASIIKLKNLMDTLENDTDRKFNLNEIKKIENKLIFYKKVKDLR